MCMAEEHGGQTRDTAPLWTKLFSGFRIAILPSKLLLAGAGLLSMAAGWWVLSVVFFALRPEPKVGDYLKDTKDPKERQEAWDRFKQARASYNLFYSLAGPRPVARDAADEAGSFEEYDLIDRIVTYGV